MFKRIKTFFKNLFNKKSEKHQILPSNENKSLQEVRELNYNEDNGYHIWDEKDTILSFYFTNLINSKSTKQENPSTRFISNYKYINREMMNNFGITINEFAQNIIGCSEGALHINTLVILSEVYGVKTKREHPNQHQVALKHNDELINKSLYELKELVHTIIDEILNDEIRVKYNEEARCIREIINELKTHDKEYIENDKKTKQRKESELKRDLENAKMKTTSPKPDEVEEYEINEGTLINHPEYGKGIIIASDSKVSFIEFPNYDFGLDAKKQKIEYKEFSNFFLRKLIEN